MAVVNSPLYLIMKGAGENMEIYYIRANGDTFHNNPSNKFYIQGEPPKFPKKTFNYQKECLEDGFARVGHPGTGDLRDPSWRKKAFDIYGLDENHLHFSFLEEFRLIRTGDYILLPTGKSYEAYIGKVVKRDLFTRDVVSSSIGENAYYYYFDVSKKQWYDNAHRVDVIWAQEPDGNLAKRKFTEIGGMWRRGFYKVGSMKSRVLATINRFDL
jgi:hypothetical protein